MSQLLTPRQVCRYMLLAAAFCARSIAQGNEQQQAAAADLPRAADPIRDYTALEPLEISVDVDGTLHPLRVEAGESLRTVSESFATRLGLPVEDVVPSLVQGLVERGSVPKQAARRAAADNAGVRRPIAQVPVVVNDEPRTAVMYEDEDPVTAARRFATDTGLITDEELDSVLRTLVNRLRYALGARDGLPLTIDAVPTVATVDVNTGDGTGRILVMRILVGETAADAASGFLERTGFDESNFEALRRLAQGKVDQALQAAAAAAPPSLIDEIDGFVLPVSFDGRAEEMPLVFRYGQVPAQVARDFLAGAGLAEHANFASFVADVEAAIVAQLAVRGRRATGTAAEAAQTAGQADAVVVGDLTVRDFEEAIQPVLAAAPYSAVVPLQVGGIGFDVEVPQGVPLRAVARVFCAKEWTALRGEFQAALDSLAANGTDPATATPDMCSIVTSDLMGRWYVSKGAPAPAPREPASGAMP